MVTKKTLQTSIDKLNDLKGVKSKAMSAFNKQTTVVKNEVRDYFNENNLPANTELHYRGEIYTYGAGESETIDPKKLYDLVKSKEITLDEFFKCVSVAKTTAKNIVGEDRLFDMTERTKTKTASLRISDKGQKTDSIKVKKPKIKTKIRRKQSTAQLLSAKPNKRKLRLKTSR